MRHLDDDELGERDRGDQRFRWQRLGVLDPSEQDQGARPERMTELPAEVLDSLGPCRILIDIAGVTAAGAFMDEEPDDLHWIVDINVWGVVHGCRAFRRPC